MIITRTPMRISFVGGGTDMPEFYRHHDGAVISMGINKYVYVMINPKFDGRFRVSYSKTENVDNWKDIQHDIVREVMHMFEFKGLEVVSVSDIPGEGSGLGSSSAFTVGLLKAAWAWEDANVSAKVLAETAYKLEALVCGHRVGKQDHYAAACGGLNHFLFTKNDVKLTTFGFLDEELLLLHDNMLLFWTGVTRKADDILAHQSLNLSASKRAYENALLMTELVSELKEAFDQRRFAHFGRCIAADWQLKKTFYDGITNEWIDTAIGNALLAGAEGAKICGAGGGGFMFVVAKPNRHADIEKAVGFRRVPFKIGVRGSMVVFEDV